MILYKEINFEKSIMKNAICCHTYYWLKMFMVYVVVIINIDATYNDKTLVKLLNFNLLFIFYFCFIVGSNFGLSSVYCHLCDSQYSRWPSCVFTPNPFYLFFVMKRVGLNSSQIDDCKWRWFWIWLIIMNKKL